MITLPLRVPVVLLLVALLARAAAGQITPPEGRPTSSSSQDSTTAHVPHPSSWLDVQNKAGSTAESEHAVELALKWLAAHQMPDGGWRFDHFVPEQSVRCRSECGPKGEMGRVVNAATALAVVAFVCHGNTHEAGPYRENVANGLRFLVRRMGTGDSLWENGGRMYSHALGLWALCEDCRVSAETPGRAAENLDPLSEIPSASAKGPSAGPQGRSSPLPRRAAKATKSQPELTTDDVRLAAAKALRYTFNAQDKLHGGWRYAPGNDSDISVTGWQVVALNSATKAGFPIPRDTLLGVIGYLESLESRFNYESLGADVVPGNRDAAQANMDAVWGSSSTQQDKEGSTSSKNAGEPLKYAAAQYTYGTVRDGYAVTYGYQTPKTETINQPAIGLLCRIYTGWDRQHPGLQGGLEILDRQGPSGSNLYYDYYATMALHHAGGALWENWNAKMREYLIRTQSREGHATGSWHFDDKDYHTAEGGRLYNTCLACLILETYYRNKPVFSTSPSPPSSNSSPGDRLNPPAEKADP